MSLPTYYICVATDSIRDGYQQLRALVMAYGDISPESPLSMSQVTDTSLTSSQQTTPTPEMATPTIEPSVAPSDGGGEKVGGGGGGGGGERGRGREEGGEGESERKVNQQQPMTVPYPTPEVTSKMKVMCT